MEKEEKGMGRKRTMMNEGGKGRDKKNVIYT